MGSDDLDRAARELLARLEIFPATNERAWLLITSANVAALVCFAEEARREGAREALVHVEMSISDALRHRGLGLMIDVDKMLEEIIAPPPPAPGPDARPDITIEDLRAAMRYALDFDRDDEEDVHGVGPRYRGDVYGYDRVMGAAFPAPAPGPDRPVQPERQSMTPGHAPGQDARGVCGEED